MYRLLGFLVVVSLVIILMPFFQTQKQLSTEAALMKVPPFPDQPAQVAANEPATISPVQPLPSQESINQQPDDVINPAHPVAMQNAPAQETVQEAVPVATSAPPSTASNTSPAPAVQDSGEQKVVAQMIDEEVTPSPTAVVKVQKTMVKSAHATSSKHNEPSAQKKVLKSKLAQHTPSIKPFVQPASNDSNGLINLKSQVWVIQVGSYKNKSNALRVVNRLRANGYRAFIQTAVDDTRVFVGPENKRAMAHSVATRLQNEMNIRGIVISYQPLAL